MKSSTTQINVNANKISTESTQLAPNALPEKVIIPQPQHAPTVIKMKSHQIHSVFANKTLTKSMEHVGNAELEPHTDQTVHPVSVQDQTKFKTAQIVFVPLTSTESTQLAPNVQTYNTMMQFSRNAIVDQHANQVLNGIK